MKKWTAVIEDVPEPNPEYPEDPQDWEIILERRDGTAEHPDERIFITLTGKVDDDNHVTATPKDQVEEWIDAMLNGLNFKELSK